MELEPLLERWANYYLVTSTAAATLIGLLFVVITLAAERGVGDSAKIRMYLTPTVVYFASVLIVAALLTFPNQTPLTAALCVCLFGAIGFVYSASKLIGHRKMYEQWHDVIPYAVFPSVAYGLLVFGGILVLHASRLGLTVVAVSILSLLTIGIRNSWAIAMWVVSAGSGRHK
jgi:hypothetical protein